MYNKEHNMAKKGLNGWTKWVLFAVSMALIIAAWIWQASTIVSRVEVNCAEITSIQPDVSKNTEHRIRFEERVDNMDKNITEILKKVSKE